MTQSNTTKLPTEDQAAEQATSDYLRNRYPKMKEKTANLWAEVIAAEEKERVKGIGEKNAKMAPELATHIEDSREEVKSVLRSINEKRIRARYEEALKENDFYVAMLTREQAEAKGIDLRDIEDTIPTTIDLEALRRGEIPLSALS